MTQRARTHAVFSTLTTLAALCFVIQLGTMVSACSKNKRYEVISATVIVVDTAHDGFHTWDTVRQEKILDESPTREVFTAKINAHRAERDRMRLAFKTVYRALALAATQNDDPSLTGALAQASELVEAIKKLTGGP